MEHTHLQLNQPSSPSIALPPDHIIKRIQLGNVLSFILAMILNSTASLFAPKTLREVSDETAITIQPAGYAFSIWGLIYFLLAIFTVYQALPSARSDSLIFSKIKYWYMVNMVFNSLWLVVFQQATSVSFFFGLLLIIGILATCIYIMEQSLCHPNNFWTFLSLRLGFSVYSGWVTAATILNFSIFLKSVGMSEPDLALSEETLGIIVLYVAWVIYLMTTIKNQNPVYGSIFIWVLMAIRAKQQKEPNLPSHCLIIAIIHSVFLVGYTIFLAIRKAQGKTTKGLFF